MPDSTVAYRAKWILPVEQPPIENGTIVCRNGMIDQIGNGLEVGTIETHDLGDVAIIPGLVNAHTHLEFSDLDTPLGDPAAGFTQWIGAVISQRRSQANLTDKPSAIQKGIRESLEAGVVAVGEIATTPWDHDCYGEELHGIIFHEQLGNNPLEATSKTAAIEAKVNGLSSDFWQAGISPHAPYSTGLNLFQSLVDLASQNNTPVAMHLAETLEEVEFVETGKGPFAEMLEAMGVPFKRSGPLNIGDYLSRLSTVHALVIHGNFLSAEELKLISSLENQHIVYCPRTHQYFGHPEYPLRSMLDLNINVAVGTDSRASNPDLDLFAELKQIAKSQPTVSPEEILAMGTLNGAKALQLDKHFGTLAAGKSASFCVITGVDSNEPTESLFQDETQCRCLQSVEKDLE